MMKAMRETTTICDVFVCVKATGFERACLRLRVDVDVRHADQRSLTGGHHM